MAMQTQSRISRCAAAVALSVSIACAASAASAAGVAAEQMRPDKATQMLFDAVHTNDFTAAEAAVAAGADVEARDRWDSSPVELAVDKGYFRIAHFLVSVRNSRAPAAEVASRAPTQPAQPARAAAPSRPQAAASSATKAASVPAKAAPQPQQLAAQPQWPAGTPNPFDPAAPAFGTALPVIPPTPPTAANSAEGEGPMLANDEAAQRTGQAVR